MKFSIVVPTYNRIDTLRQTLAVVTRQTFADYEVIVVDDGSTDGTPDRIAPEFPSVRIIRQSANRGPAAARNAGIHAATGTIIAFTDDDCVPPPDWLARLANGYARYPHVVGVGGYLDPPDDVVLRSPLARYERYIARSVYGVGEQEYVGGFECPAGGTNNVSYRREVLEQAGGFDETFRHAAGEDADLKWRICQADAQLAFVPIRVIHLQTYTWPTFKRQCYYRGKGRTRFEAKHGPRPTLARSTLRLVRRWLTFPLDAIWGERRSYARPRTIEAWHSYRGEWDMIGEMRTWTSST